MAYEPRANIMVKSFDWPRFETRGKKELKLQLSLELKLQLSLFIRSS